MELFRLEHSRAAYCADFAMYGAAVILLAGFLTEYAPAGQRAVMLALALVGLMSWTGIEYVLHRFVLHGIDPFRRWHAQHHQRPSALIAAPTILSASLIASLVFLPALLVLNGWRAGALTLGVLTGYVAYAVTHHATHHWRADNAWLAQRKRWHALHHHQVEHPGCYGVTSGFWDRVFGSAPRSGASLRG